MASTTTLDPEQERLRKARLWESMVQAGTPPGLATIFVQSGQGVAPPPTPGSNPLADIARGAAHAFGLAGRAAQRAVGGLAGAAAATPAVILGPAGFQVRNEIMNRIAGGAEQAGTAVGLPEPQGVGERLAVTGMAGAMGGAPFGIPGVVGGLTGGLGQQGTAELGGGPGLQTLIGLLAGAAGGKMGQRMERLASPQAEAAHMMGEPARRAGDQPVEQLRQAQAIAKGSPDLMGFEAMDRARAGGSEIAQRIAQEGGTAADPLLNRIADKAEGLANQQRLRANDLAGQEAVRQSRLGDQARLRVQQLSQQARTAFTKTLDRVLSPRQQPGGLDVEQQLAADYQPRIAAAYDKVRWQPVQIDEPLAALMDDPTFRRYGAQARTAYNAGVETPGPGEARVSRRTIPDFEYVDSKGNIHTRSDMPVAFFDETKKAIQNALLDKSLSESDRAGAAALLNRMDAIITEHVDPQVPAYAPTRGLAQEYAQMRDALAFGRDIKQPSVRQETRGQVDARRPGAGEDVVRARLEAMSPAEQAMARAGRIYSLMEIAKKSPTPWKAIGDLERHAPFLTPEQMGELSAARALAEGTAKGIGDLKLEAIKAEKAANPMATDLPSQQIADRAETMGRVLSAGKPGAMQDRANKAKAILVDILIRANRSAIRDLQTADQSKILYRPAVRRTLAEGLAQSGQPFDAFLQEMIQRLADQRTAVGRGVVGSGVAAAGQPPR